MRKILLLIPAFICPVLILCQTITPIYVANDSIDIVKIQFIDPKNGAILKCKTEGHLIHINDILPDTIKLIIPFKEGNLIILDKVETKYFSDCVIDAIYVAQNSSKFNECSRIVYHSGDRILFGNMYCYPASSGRQIDISSDYSYYAKKTEGLKIDLSKRRKLFFRNLKRRFPGLQFKNNP